MTPQKTTKKVRRGDPVSRRGKSQPTGPTRDELDAEALKKFGLVKGQKLRFRTSEGGDWTLGNVNTVEKDGSLRLYVANRAARSIMPECCQVQARGPRGGILWEPLKDMG